MGIKKQTDVTTWNKFLIDFIRKKKNFCKIENTDFDDFNIIIKLIIIIIWMTKNYWQLFSLTAILQYKIS